MDTPVWGKTTDPIRMVLMADGAYEGGSAFVVERGIQHEVRVTRMEPDSGGDEQGDLYLESVQQIYHDGFCHPGLAFTEIVAVATEDLGDGLEYEAIVDGKVVEVYDSGTETWSIEFSRNPMCVMRYLATRPVIHGDGDTIPFEVEYHAGLDPDKHLKLIDHIEVAQWCDDLVDDGNGGTEARCYFDGVFEQGRDAYEQILKVAATCRVMVFWDGHVLRFRVERPALPVATFTASNILSPGFQEQWTDASSTPDEVEIQIENESRDFHMDTVLAVSRNPTTHIRKRLDGFGIGRVSQAIRAGSFVLRKLHYQQRHVSFEAGLDAYGCEPGDIV